MCIASRSLRLVDRTREILTGEGQTDPTGAVDAMFPHLQSLPTSLTATGLAEVSMDADRSSVR